MTGRVRFGIRAILVGLAVAALAACYVPDKFQSEVRINNNGDYALTFIGDLVWQPFNLEAQQGKHTPEDIASEVDILTRDLSRDKNFKELKSLGDGRFHVRYERQGHLGVDDEVTFVRRNEIIILLRSKPDGTISIDGAAVKPADAERLTTAGASTAGEFHVVTDGLVKESNASQIKTMGAYTVYIWQIKDAFTPAPHFVMQRVGNFAAGK